MSPKPQRKAAAPYRPNAIGDELFDLVQASQGSSFISDAISGYSTSQILSIAEASLFHTLETAKLLRRFLKKHSPSKRS